jgi:hypothetical protein
VNPGGIHTGKYHWLLEDALERISDSRRLVVNSGELDSGTGKLLVAILKKRPA